MTFDKNNFLLISSSKESKARLGVLRTPHGNLPTPFFMPIATKGAVKTLSSFDVERLFRCRTSSANSPILLANTYHLYLRPGPDVIRAFGGLHNFMSWPGVLLTDSGGYQVFSLAKMRELTEEGATFASHIDGSRHLLTPELSIHIQQNLGSDIVMVLDECAPPDMPRQKLEASVARTTRWAKRSKIEFEKGKNSSPNLGAQLFGIVQGATIDEIRARHAEELQKIGFHGYAIGGLSVGEPLTDACRIVSLLDEKLPADKPRYFMGGAKPHEIVEYVKRGVDMFDCVLPTRNARHGLLYRFAHDDLNRPDFYQTIHLTNENLKISKEPLVPIMEGDDIAEELSRYSLGYVRHLFAVQETLGQRLVTLANLRFYLELMNRIRTSISRNGL